MKKEQTPPFGLRLPPELKMWVKMKAKREDRSMNYIINRILTEAMNDDFQEA